MQLSKHHYIYKYTEKQLQYESNIKGFDFTLPKNTKELIDIAVELSICVASYEDYILDNYCTILGVYKHGKVLLCLEIDSYRNCINQVKKYRNQLLVSGKNSEEDNLIEAMYEFLVSKDLEIDTIDLIHSKIHFEKEKAM